jgi:hypothetical protein
MLRNAHGLHAPPLGARSRSDLLAHDAVGRVLDELSLLAEAGWTLGRRDVLAALERASVRGERADAPGRVAVIDPVARSHAALRHGLRPRARARCPASARSRRAVSGRGHAPRPRASRGARLVRPDPASRDRYLFATACTARGGASCSCGRRSATRARRASRARSGRPCVSSSTRTTSAPTSRRPLSR